VGKAREAKGERRQAEAPTAQNKRDNENQKLKKEKHTGRRSIRKGSRPAGV
jgi:hypothetical protein